MKKNAHQFLFIGSLEMLRTKLQKKKKNRTKNVGFLVLLSKTLKLVFLFLFFIQNIRISKKNHNYEQNVLKISFHI